MSEEKQSNSAQSSEVPELEHEAAPPSPARKQKPVFVYLAVMFGAAFLLLLFAYLMQQRNSAEIMGNLSDLRESMRSFQSLDEVLDDNRALREENKTLEEQLDELERRCAGLEDELTVAQSDAETWRGRYDDAQGIVNAFDQLASVHALYEQGRAEEARAILESLPQREGVDEVEYYMTIYVSKLSGAEEVLETFNPLEDWQELKEQLNEG